MDNLALSRNGTLMRAIIALVLFFAALATPSMAAWEGRISAHDRERLEQLPASRAEGLAGAEAAGRAERALVNAIVARAVRHACARLSVTSSFFTATDTRSDFAGTAMSLTGGPAGATGVGLLVRF